MSEEIQSSASEFLLNFDALLKANEAEEIKSASLKSVRIALESEIQELKAKRNLVEVQIKEALSKVDTEIESRRGNAERNFESERLRLANLSKKLESQRKEQEEIEIVQRRRNSEFSEQSRLLAEEDVKLKYREVDLNSKLAQLEKDLQRIASENMDIKRKFQFIDEQLYCIEQEKQGLQANQAELKKQQSILRETEAEFKNRIKEIAEVETKNSKEKQEIEILKEELGKQQEQISASINILNKQKKDLTDKEKAVKAMQIDLDFKMAQINRQKQK